MILPDKWNLPLHRCVGASCSRCYLGNIDEDQDALIGKLLLSLSRGCSGYAAVSQSVTVLGLMLMSIRIKHLKWYSQI